MTDKKLQPLRINARCVSDFETIRGNISYCCNLGLRYFVPTEQKNDYEAVLVGSAPSVKTQINSLKRKRGKPQYKFFGIKGGHDFLLKNKIQPDFGLAVDPLEKIHKENFLLDAENCTYFIASQCHPTLFDSLIERDKQIIIWHLLTENLDQWGRDPESPGQAE